MRFYGPNCTHETKELNKFPKDLKLILVIRIDTTDFADTVRKYNSLPPFSFPQGNFPTKPDISIYMSIYAAHLYDSVILYAKVGLKDHQT